MPNQFLFLSNVKKQRTASHASQICKKRSAVALGEYYFPVRSWAQIEPQRESPGRGQLACQSSHDQENFIGIFKDHYWNKDTKYLETLVENLQTSENMCTLPHLVPPHQGPVHPSLRTKHYEISGFGCNSNSWGGVNRNIFMLESEGEWHFRLC